MPCRIISFFQITKMIKNMQISHWQTPLKGEFNGFLVFLSHFWSLTNYTQRSPLWNTVSPEDREMCHRMQDDGEFWWVCFIDAHNNTQNTESCPFNLIRGGLKLRQPALTHLSTGWNWRISASSTPTWTSAACVLTSWMETLPVTGKPTATRADGLQESLLEDA